MKREYSQATDITVVVSRYLNCFFLVFTLSRRIRAHSRNFNFCLVKHRRMQALHGSAINLPVIFVSKTKDLKRRNQMSLVFYSMFGHNEDSY